MSSDVAAVAAVPEKKWMIWTGRVMTAVAGLGLAASAIMELAHQPPVSENMAKYGYSPTATTAIGVVELLCVALYFFPRTAVLGAALMTAYLGGAVSTHVRAGEPYQAAIILGIVAWGGLFGRDARIRALLPLNSQ